MSAPEMNAASKIAARVFLTVATLAITATTVFSAPITVPASLNPGDQYRLAFVTSGTSDATSPNIDDYNAFVTAAANSQSELAALGATWMVVGSTETVDARDNTGTNPELDGIGVPIFLLDANSTKFAENNLNLWGNEVLGGNNVLARLNITEFGTVRAPDVVWTGTFADGTVASDGQWPCSFCLQSGLGGANPVLAFTEDGNRDVCGPWINCYYEESAFVQHPLFAISSIITVASVPEPGLGLLSLGLAALTLLRRKRKI